MDEIGEFVDRTFGPFGDVLDEIESPDIHVDIIPVPATPARPWLSLVSMGASAYAMRAPAGVSPFVESFIIMPEDWPTEVPAIKREGENAWWPYRWLKSVARLPITNDAWIGEGHTLADNAREPFAPDCRFVAVLLTQRLWPADAAPLHLNSSGKVIRFLQLVPLFAEEFEYRAQRGTDALIERLRGIPLHELANPTRPGAILS
jgi:hypothetical protein